MEAPTTSLYARLTLVQVPYVTNRAVDADGIERGLARGESPGYEAVFKSSFGQGASYGVALISSPIDRKPGQYAYAKGTRQENPFYNMAFWNYTPYPSDTALKAACDRIFAARHDAKVLLYVHGMDNSFSDTVERLAQLVLDLGVDVIPLAFSWPSDIARTVPDREMTVPLPPDYRLTRSAADRSVGALAGTFEVAASLDHDVRLLAHSMGAYVVDRAVAGLRDDGKDPRQRFSAVALAAPDVGLDGFLADGLQRLLRVTSRLTVYCSDDYALGASRLMNGAARLGRCPDDAPALPGATSVRVTGGISDFSRHSYFLNSARVIENLRDQVLGPPKPRGAGPAAIDKALIDVGK